MGEMVDDLQHRIAARLRSLRSERGWSLDDLAHRSGVSRATLSRLENAETSPTTQILAKLATAYGLTLTRIVHMAEEGFRPLVRRAEQPVFEDRMLDFRRRSVSPPDRNLRAEMLECRLGPGQVIEYEAPPRPGLEHHLLLLAGALEMTVDGADHRLAAGDCLRFQLHGPSRFATAMDQGAHYVLCLV